MEQKNNNSICDVPGIKVGHFHLLQARTGCTVILPEHPAVTGVDVRGSAPGTREIELLKPVRLVNAVHAILLSGGSAFGLNAAAGVQKYLSEQGIGFDTGVARVPIVPAAVIFDMAVGASNLYPDSDMGYQACVNAYTQNDERGAVGAGCGATVGKILGMEKCSSGGIGMASLHLANGVVIGALSVVNAFGEIVDDQQNILAGVQDADTFLPTLDIMQKNLSPTTFSSVTNTTLTVVATNAHLSKETATKTAQMAQDGLARAIRPAHTMLDGDIVFCLSTGNIEMDITTLGSLACEVTAASIRNAVFK